MVAHLVPLELHHVEQAKKVIRQVWREHFGAHADPDVRSFLDRTEAFPDLDTWNQTTLHRPDSSSWRSMPAAWSGQAGSGVSRRSWPN
jgi:hypothetical protein